MGLQPQEWQRRFDSVQVARGWPRAVSMWSIRGNSTSLAVIRRTVQSRAGSFCRPFLDVGPLDPWLLPFSGQTLLAVRRKPVSHCNERRRNFVPPNSQSHLSAARGCSARSRLYFGHSPQEINSQGTA